MGKKGKKSAAARAEPADASPVHIESSEPVDSALQVHLQTIKPGDDSIRPTEGDVLTVHYTGTLRDDGSEFDSSRAKKQPFTFTLGKGEVIRGWELGLVQMSLGQRARLTIAPEAGYGEKGCVDKESASGTGVIPPNATLLFDVELLDINSQRSLGRYLSTLDDWIQAKLLAFDEHEGVRERMTEKYGSRDAYACQEEVYVRTGTRAICAWWPAPSTTRSASRRMRRGHPRSRKSLPRSSLRQPRLGLRQRISLRQSR